ncbi:hypothetical protein [Aeromonas taiwanensis]|uniref:hypothetical protein n=1 Tax=Aeromonas taiwanensis TaxID=633417 RepID=UPI003BA3D6CC
MDTSSVAYTYPEVFILESLGVEDEEKERFEGRILYRMLKLAGKKPKYYYFRTQAELEMLAQTFLDTQYRFLHLSCHGTGNGVKTTLDEVSNVQFAKIFQGKLKNRRLFISACETGNELFSECIFGQNRGMYSIVAPIDQIRFDYAAAIWNSLYIKIFSENSSYIKNKTIKQALCNLSNMFNVKFHWSYHDTYAKGITHQKISPRPRANKSIKTPTKSVGWDALPRAPY